MLFRKRITQYIIYIYERIYLYSTSMHWERSFLIKTLPRERDQCLDDESSDKTIRWKFYCVLNLQ